MQVDAPIVVTVVQAQGQTALQWRTLVVLEEGAEAEVWEQYVSADDDTDGLLNTVVELSVGQNARLRYVCAQGLSEKSWIFGTQRATVERDGALDWIALGFGSGNGRVAMDTKLIGPGADAKVTGAYATHGRQHLDYATTQVHDAPNTTSDLAFRGILDGRSNTVWSGMIKVEPGAQQIDAFQESRNLLLTKTAHADSIPGLEILANDVRCTHAAAIAQIDLEQLFYLRSRGLRSRRPSAWSSRASSRRPSSASSRASCARPSRARSSAGSSSCWASRLSGTLTRQSAVADSTRWRAARDRAGRAARARARRSPSSGRLVSRQPESCA